MKKMLAVAVLLACTIAPSIMAETITSRNPRAGGDTVPVLVAPVAAVAAPPRRPRAGGTTVPKAALDELAASPAANRPCNGKYCGRNHGNQ